MNEQKWYKILFNYGDDGIEYDWIIIEPVVGERFILMERESNLYETNVTPIEWKPVSSFDLNVFNRNGNYE